LETTASFFFFVSELIGVWESIRAVSQIVPYTIIVTAWHSVSSKFYPKADQLHRSNTQGKSEASSHQDQGHQ
jgi:hypothetical protein